MNVTFELATERDDAGIRRLLRTQPMPGTVGLRYEREPSFFHGCKTHGRTCQVLVARRQPSGEVVGVACRAIRPLFVNGREERVGYMSQLRVKGELQGRWVLSRGFRAMSSLHADGQAVGYLATITDDNATARGVLVSRRRPHFPHFSPVTDIETMALVASPAPVSRPPRVELSHATPSELPSIVVFLRREGKRRQFFPAYNESDFGAGGTTPGFDINDFILARENNRLVGVMGLWDQSSYKQTVVDRYSGALRRVRPLYNLGAWMRRFPKLPAPGQPIRFACASFVCVADDDPEVFATIVAHARAEAARRGHSYLMLGMSRCDPLAEAARRFHHFTYMSTLYTVHWPDGESFHDQLDGRVPYVEIAAL